MFSLWTLNFEPRCRQDLPTWSQDGPKSSILEPTWSQDLPTCSQDGPKTSQLGAKMVPRPPTWSQDGPKTSNLEPLTPEQHRKTSIFYVFFNVFAILAKLHTRSNLTSILEPRCPPNPQLGDKMAPSSSKTPNSVPTCPPRAPTWTPSPLKNH